MNPHTWIIEQPWICCLPVCAKNKKTTNFQSVSTHRLSTFLPVWATLKWGLFSSVPLCSCSPSVPRPLICAWLPSAASNSFFCYFGTLGLEASCCNITGKQTVCLLHYPQGWGAHHDYSWGLGAWQTHSSCRLYQTLEKKKDWRAARMRVNKIDETYQKNQLGACVNTWKINLTI